MMLPIGGADKLSLLLFSWNFFPSTNRKKGVKICWLTRLSQDSTFLFAEPYKTKMSPGKYSSCLHSSLFWQCVGKKSFMMLPIGGAGKLIERIIEWKGVEICWLTRPSRDRTFLFAEPYRTKMSPGEYNSGLLSSFLTNYDVAYRWCPLT